jgi:hypothetical protein
MSTFYLLPPRPVVAEHLADFFRTLVPGLDLSGLDPVELVEPLLAGQSDAYLVWREELPAGEDLVSALRSGFGATAGDVVVDVRARAGALVALRWEVPPAVRAA